MEIYILVPHIKIYVPHWIVARNMALWLWIGTDEYKLIIVVTTWIYAALDFIVFKLTK